MSAQDDEASFITIPLPESVWEEEVRRLEAERRRDPNRIISVYRVRYDGKKEYIWDENQVRHEEPAAPPGPPSRDWTDSSEGQAFCQGLIRENGRIRSARLARKETTGQRIARMLAEEE